MVSSKYEKVELVNLDWAMGSEAMVSNKYESKSQ